MLHPLRRVVRCAPAPAVALALICCALAPDARAWNHTGHRVSALVAWQHLSPPARAEATRLLRAHPRYREDLLLDMPAGHGDPDAWAFMTAATWPDIVRDERNPMHAAHHKGPWHYVDWAYAPDGDRRSYRDGPAEAGGGGRAPGPAAPGTTGAAGGPGTSSTRSLPNAPGAAGETGTASPPVAAGVPEASTPPLAPAGAGSVPGGAGSAGDAPASAAEPLSVLQAIPYAERTLGDPAASEEARAVALCWYLHLVGDLHQPLHATSLVNDDFPEGDRGGNSTLVLYNGEAVNLHAYWDRRLGTSRDPAELTSLAARATADAPRAPMGSGALPAGPSELARESRRLAVPYAYLYGHLSYTRRGPDGNLLAPAPPLPPGYEESTAAIARRRVAQAGYRMGEALSRQFDPAYTPAIAPVPEAGPGAGGELLRPGK